LTLAICFLGYTGLVISIWPYIVPPSLTIWDASSSHSSQLFALVGTVIVLPIILVYNVMQYRVFRGKVREGDAGYH
jgi:cytochrome d ubiquinol oxidase subunit II